MICTCCRCENFSNEYYLKDIKHKTTDKSFLLKKCENCKTYLITENGSIVNTKNYYPKEYSAFQEVISNRSDIDKKYNSYVLSGRLAWTKLIKIKQDDKILDIGCGNGSNMYFLQNNYKAEIIGLEPSSKAVMEGKKIGLNIVQGKIEEYNTKTQFDVIYMLHVIEHLKDPKLVLGKIWDMLNPGGKLVIGTPNSRSFERILFKRYWDGWDTPRHIYVFNSKSLESILYEVGFNNIQVFYEVYSLFYRSVQNICKNKNMEMSRLVYELSKKVNKILSYILPFLKFSGAIQIIAEKR